MVMGAGALHVLVALLSHMNCSVSPVPVPSGVTRTTASRLPCVPSPRKVLCSSDTDPGVAPGWSCPGLWAPPAKEISHVDPPELVGTGIVDPGVMHEPATLRDQQLEIADPAPVRLNHDRVTGDAGAGLTVDGDGCRGAPCIGGAVEPHELQRVTGAGPVWGDPDNGLEVAVRPVAAEGALQQRHRSRCRTGVELPRALGPACEGDLARRSTGTGRHRDR